MCIYRSGIKCKYDNKVVVAYVPIFTGDMYIYNIMITARDVHNR